MLRKTALVTLALMLLVAAPAVAGQGEPPEVDVTGVIERPEFTTYAYGSHAVVDEESGERYALRSEEDEGLLDDATGRRTTVSGALVPGYENGAVEGGPPLVEVDRVVPAAEEAAGEIDVNGDGAVNEADGKFAAAVSAAAGSEARNAGRSVLPATGGPPLLGAISLLLGAGFLAYRAW